VVVAALRARAFKRGVALTLHWRRCDRDGDANSLAASSVKVTEAAQTNNRHAIRLLGPLRHPVARG
jgi:hypothetical protein